MTSYSADSQSVHVTLQYFDAWNVAGQVWAETPQNFFCSTNNVLILYFILNPAWLFYFYPNLRSLLT